MRSCDAEPPSTRAQEAPRGSSLSSARGYYKTLRARAVYEGRGTDGRKHGRGTDILAIHKVLEAARDAQGSGLVSGIRWHSSERWGRTGGSNTAATSLQIESAGGWGVGGGGSRQERRRARSLLVRVRAHRRALNRVKRNDAKGSGCSAWKRRKGSEKGAEGKQAVSGTPALSPALTHTPRTQPPNPTPPAPIFMRDALVARRVKLSAGQKSQPPRTAATPSTMGRRLRFDAAKLAAAPRATP
jgi:hypothetical protein